MHCLEFDALPIEFNVLDLEINADGSDEGWGKRIVCISQQQTGLPHTLKTREEKQRKVIGTN